MKTYIKSFMMLLLAGSVLIGFSSCSDILDPKKDNPFGSLTKTSIGGIVVDENGKPVSGAVVTVLGSTATATTNSKGLFVMKDVNVPENRAVVKSVVKGYFTATRAFTPRTNGRSMVQLTMSAEALMGNVNAGTGGTVKVAAGLVSLPAGAIVTSTGDPYTGQVNVIGRYLDPTASNFGALTPGGDLAGTDASGNFVALYSQGVMDVKLESPAGDALQLGNGKEATLTYPIATGRMSSADATEPLWYFDETTGLWKEEGVATKNGTVYTGNVKHFTSWNCDYKGDTAGCEGRVIDCNGDAIAGAYVNLDGPTMQTDEDGRFRHWIPAKRSLNVFAYSAGSLKSPVSVIPPQEKGQTYNLGDITCPCPAYITGSLEDCSGPADGFVIARWNIGAAVQLQTVSTKSGSFKIPVATGATVTLTAFGMDGTTTEKTVTVGAAGSTANAGTFNVCSTNPPPTRTNYIVLSGGQYSNLDTIDIPGLTARINTGTKGMSITNNQGDTLYFSMNLSDTVVANYPWGSKTNSLYISRSNPRFYMYGSTGTTSLTRFDANSGGLIEGTFSGLADSSSATTIVGRFSVMRP